MAVPNEPRCSICGQELRGDAPAGLCPRCLLKAAVVLADASTPYDPDGPAEDFLSQGEAGFGSTESDSGIGRPWLPGVSRDERPDDYEIVHEIARGAMGVVYLARQRSLGRTVALKMIQAGVLAGDAELRRFQIEAEAAAGLDHPGIVPVYESGTLGGHPFFSMAYVPGESLSRLLGRGPLAPRRAAILLRDVARAVQYAHSRGVVHRDLKPSNILIDRDGHPRVTDFGLAKRLDEESSLTHSGAVMGTPSFMSPEQARGQNDRVDERTDVYSLGATLYALLTARPPFQASTSLDTLRQVFECDPAPPRQINAEVDRDLETICLKCLEKQPARRYATAETLAADLDRWIRHEPIEARPASMRERVVKWGMRRPATAALVAVIVAALVTVIALGLRDLQRGRATIVAVSTERDRAQKSARQALSAGREARRQARENQRRLVRSAIASGDRLVEDGNLLMALPWYVHALRNEPDGPAAERRHRIRIASVLDAAPRLTRLDRAPLDPPDARARDIAPDAIKVALPPVGTGRVVHKAFLGGGQRFLTVQEIDPPAGAEAAGEICSELRVWSAETGALVAGPARFSLAGIAVELNAQGDRLMVRGDHARPRRWPVPRGGNECHLLDARSLETILPPPGEVLRVACFSPDGQRMLAASALDRRIGRAPAGYQPLPGERVGPDHSVYVAGTSADARAYSTSDGKTDDALLNHEMPIERMAYAPDGGTAITSGGNLIHLWDVATWRLLAAGLQGYSFLGYSPDSRSFLLVRYDVGAPQVWFFDRDIGRLYAASPPLPSAGWSPTIRPGNRDSFFGTFATLSASFTPDHREVVLTSRNRQVNELETRQWTIPLYSSASSTVELPAASNRARLVTGNGPSGPDSFRAGQMVRLSPDSPIARTPSVVVIGPDGRTFSRYIKNRQRFETLVQGSGRDSFPAFELFAADSGLSLGAAPSVAAAAVLPVYGQNGQRVLVVTSDTQGQASLQTLFSGGMVVGAEVRYDARWAIHYDLPREESARETARKVAFQLLDVPSLRPAGPAFSISGIIGACALSPDGKRLAVMCERERDPDATAPAGRLDELRIYDLEAGRATPVTYLVPHQGRPAGLPPVDGLLFSPDGRLLLVHQSGLEVATVETPETFVDRPAILMAVDGLRPVVPALKIARPWSPSPDQRRHGDISLAERVAAFSPDGRLVAVTDYGEAVAVFATATGRPWPEPLGHTGRIHWVGFSSDGRRLATVGAEGTARLWSTATHEPIGPPLQHSGALTAAFSRDGALLITAGLAGRVRVWDSETAESLVQAFELGPRVDAIVPGSASRSFLLTQLDAGYPITWEVPQEDRPRAIVEALSVVLSGHQIDGGEGLAPAPGAKVEAARSALLRHEPGYFTEF